MRVNIFIRKHKFPINLVNCSSRVSQMRSTGGGRKCGQNGQKLHEIGIWALEQWWGGMGGQANFLGSEWGIPPVPPPPQLRETLCSYSIYISSFKIPNQALT